VERKYLDYLRADWNFSWPDQVRQDFEVISHDNIYIEPGSQRERDFLDLCIKLEIIPFVSKYGVFGCLKKEVGQRPYYYLDVKSSSDYPNRQFEERSTGCPGDSRPCGNGTVQIEKVSLSPKMTRKLDRLDIMTIPSAGGSSHILMTKRIKELFSFEGITGCHLIPCLEEGRSYSPEAYIFKQDSLELERKAKYFQLTVTAKVLQYPNIGRLLAWKQCSTCGVVGMFQPHLLKGNTMFFQTDDLNTSDLQVCDGRRSDNIGLFHTKSDWIIVSARLLRLLLDHKVAGIDTPPWPQVEVEIVDIR